MSLLVGWCPIFAGPKNSECFWNLNLKEYLILRYAYWLIFPVWHVFLSNLFWMLRYYFFIISDLISHTFNLNPLNVVKLLLMQWHFFHLAPDMVGYILSKSWTAKIRHILLYRYKESFYRIFPFEAFPIHT